MAGLILLVAGALPGLAAERAADTAFFSLANGLEVIVVVTPSPLMASLAVVKAGSRDEDVGNNGVSHLLEHLLFDGTARRSREAIFREVYGMGGYINGFTREDLTGYILMAHPDFAERILDIQADILFRSRIEPAKLKATKDVVKEEIRQALTRPEYQEETVQRQRVFRGTPYARPVLGFEASIEALPRKAILDYYRGHYAPNNMTLILIGPLGDRALRPLVEKTFGAEPPRPLPPPREVQWAGPPTGGGMAAATSAPRRSLVLTWGGPLRDQAEYAALQVLASLIKARLERASEAPGAPRTLKIEASLGATRDLWTLEVTVAFPKEGREEPIREMTGAELRRLATAALGADEFGLARREIQAEEVLLRERIHYFATAKASLALRFGPAFFSTSLDHLRALTAGDVERVAWEVLGSRQPVATSFVPGEPEAGRAARGPLPSRRLRLDNGLVVLVQQVPGSPVFAAHLLARDRALWEPEGRAGIADLLHRLLPRGTTTLDAKGIEDRLKAMGGRMETAGDPQAPFGDFYTSREFSYVRLEAMDEFGGQALDLLADVVAHPRLDPPEIERVRSQMLDFLQARAKSPGKVAEDRVMEALLKAHPFAGPVLGSEAAIRAISRADLEAFHRRYLAPGNLILSVASGTDPERVLAMVRSTFGRLPAGAGAGERAGPPRRPFPTPGEGRTVRAHLGLAQGAIEAAKLLRGVSDRERLALEVGNGVLSARLFLDLREREGLAYTIGSSVSFWGGDGLLTVAMGTAPKNLGRAREALLRTVEAVAAEPPTGEEVERRANAIAGRYTMRMLSSINRAFYLGLAEFKGYDHGFADAYRAALRAVTPAEVHAAMRKFFLPTDFTVAIVD